MTKYADTQGRSMTERILDAHKDNCAWPKKLIAEVLGTTEPYVNHVFQMYNINVGIPQTRANRERPTAGKMRTPLKFVPRQIDTQECQQHWLQDGELRQCKQPTAGHTYCPDCLAERNTAPHGTRYAQYTGPAFGVSRRTGAVA